MPSEISQIEEKRRGDFNRSMLQSGRENENDDKLAAHSSPIAMMSLWQKLGKYWPILVLAAIFDLVALIPFISVVVNFCFAIIMFLYFGKKKIVSGIIAPTVIGSVIDFFLSFFLISLWPSCFATAITRIALKEVE